MSSQKLTAQIAALYIGAKISNEWDPKNHGTRISGDILGVYKQTAFIQNFDVYGKPWADMVERKVDECQLLLSPLSAITDEHAIEAAKLASYHPDLKEDWENIICDFRVDEIVRHPDRIEIKHTCICFEGSFNLRFDGNMFMSGEDEGMRAQPEIYLPHYGIDYLRSKGYDCGYSDIPSLIEAGIAIDKTNQGRNDERSVATDPKSE